MSIGGLFSYKDGYSYNSESYAYIDCVLLKDVGTLKAGTCIPEALINLKNAKIKFNVEEKLIVVPFNISWENETITTKTVEEVDSDFDGSDDDDDTLTDESSDNADDDSESDSD